jgi:hypothetical protein
MKIYKCKLQDLVIFSVILLLWLMVHNIVIKESQQSLQTNSTKENCRLNISVLKNNRLSLGCGGGQFVSVMKSVCHTQLGNQLSSYAALFYFKHKYGFNAFIDPVQAKYIAEVMYLDKMEIKSLDFKIPKCCETELRLPTWEVVRNLNDGRSYDGFVENIDKYRYNHLIDLGTHTVPIYLYKDILPQLRQQFKIKSNLLFHAHKLLKYLRDPQNLTVFVGVHARRGDHLHAWRGKFPSSVIGRYEGKYFNHAMDLLREKYNNNSTKVVFLATSDNYAWIKQTFINPGDVFFPAELVTVPKSAAAGLDLTVLSLCDHSILDYGTFGIWGALLAGGEIVLPDGYSDVTTPDMEWWAASGVGNVTFVNVTTLYSQ